MVMNYKSTASSSLRNNGLVTPREPLPHNASVIAACHEIARSRTYNSQLSAATCHNYMHCIMYMGNTAARPLGPTYNISTNRECLASLPIVPNQYNYSFAIKLEGECVTDMQSQRCKCTTLASTPQAITVYSLVEPHSCR